MDVLVTHSIQFASKFRLSHKAVAIRAGQIDESVGIAAQQFGTRDDLDTVGRAMVDRADHGDRLAGLDDLALHQDHVAVVEGEDQHLEIALVSFGQRHEASFRSRELRCGDVRQIERLVWLSESRIRRTARRELARDRRARFHGVRRDGPT